MADPPRRRLRASRPASNTVTDGRPCRRPRCPDGPGRSDPERRDAAHLGRPGSGRTYRVSVDGSVVATPGSAGAVLPAPPRREPDLLRRRGGRLRPGRPGRVGDRDPQPVRPGHAQDGHRHRQAAPVTVRWTATGRRRRFGGYRLHSGGYQAAIRSRSVGAAGEPTSRRRQTAGRHLLGTATTPSASRSSPRTPRRPAPAGCAGAGHRRRGTAPWSSAGPLREHGGTPSPATP